MEIRVFDVSHGFCSLIIGDNGNLMLIDCGHNEQTNFRPSSYLKKIGCTGIEKLVIQNYDQDHVSDLPNLREMFDIQNLHRNKSISTTELRQLKLESGPLSDALDSMIDMVEQYNGTAVNPPKFPNMEFSIFYHDFPAFTDTNNLSVVTFIHYDGFSMVYTGDLESAGWKKHLDDRYFQNELSRVNVFVASHHGRESGYCKEVFNFCSPDIIIISDKEIIHETQKQNYANHASGVPWDGGPKKRYVLTTRSDGMISITKNISEGYNIAI